jgi:sodium-dependent dicarboxylate transporter 2/3/5
MERLEGHEELSRERAALGPLTGQEKKTIALVAAMVGLWIAGSWVQRLDVVMVALVGSVVMFLPGVRLLDWSAARERISWDTLLLIGGVTSLGSASVETGLAGWLVQALLGGVSTWSPFALVAAISAFTVLIHLALPIGPVINAVLIPPIVVLAQQAGANPAVYALPVAFSASASFLLPIDPVPALTYAHGHYSMKDMLIPGLILGAIWVAWLTPLAVWLGPIVLG